MLFYYLQIHRQGINLCAARTEIVFRQATRPRGSSINSMGDVAVARQVQIRVVILGLGDLADAVEEVEGQIVKSGARPLAANRLAVRRQFPVGAEDHQSGPESLLHPARPIAPSQGTQCSLVSSAAVAASSIFVSPES